MKRTEDDVPALASLLNSSAKGDHAKRDVVLLELLGEAACGPDSGEASSRRGSQRRR